jgi:hypothetical protein
LRAHREAAAEYARALCFADEIAPTEKARLLEALAYECYLTDQTAVGLDARRAALDIWTAATERLKMSENSAGSRMAWFGGRNDEATTAAHAALDALEGERDPKSIALRSSVSLSAPQARSRPR